MTTEIIKPEQSIEEIEAQIYQLTLRKNQLEIAAIQKAKGIFTYLIGKHLKVNNISCIAIQKINWVNKYNDTYTVSVNGLSINLDIKNNYTFIYSPGTEQLTLPINEHEFVVATMEISQNEFEEHLRRVTSSLIEQYSEWAKKPTESGAAPEQK